MIEKTPERGTLLAEADATTLAAATHTELIHLIMWMRETYEIERVVAMCDAYECGVRDERQGLISQRPQEALADS